MLTQRRTYCKYGLIAAFLSQALIQLMYMKSRGSLTLYTRRGISEDHWSTQVNRSQKLLEYNQANQRKNPIEAILHHPDSETNNGFVQSNQSIFKLSNDNTNYYFNTSEGAQCMKFGANQIQSNSVCVCLDGWYGNHCSIPRSVLTSISYNATHGRPIIASHPRKIIHAFTFNREWSMLEARMYELGNLVDVFVILESNYTLHGDPKDLLLLEKLKQGYLKQFQHKIFYVFLDHFPPKGRKDGWLAEDYFRNYLYSHGLKRITGYFDTDLFMFTDADELPSFESVLFLKVHHGYSEPVGFFLNQATFGFFWTLRNMHRISSVCSMKFFKDVARNDVQNIRGLKYKKYKWYKSSMDDHWYMGSGKAKAGWHCSWCMPPEDVQNKLISAINADFPRWGDYPSKRELPYIHKLIKTGTWFNDKKMAHRNVTYKTHPSIVPSHIRNNAEQYKFLLDLEYAA